MSRTTKRVIGTESISYKLRKSEGYVFPHLETFSLYRVKLHRFWHHFALVVPLLIPFLTYMSIHNPTLAVVSIKYNWVLFYFLYVALRFT